MNAVNGVIDGIPMFINVDDFFRSNVLLSEKTKGFYMWRYSARIILEINAERFHQGLLRLVWMPVAVAESTVYTPRTLHFTAYSNLPHAVANVNCDTSLVMDCPWVAPVTHIAANESAAGGDFGVGRVFLFNQTAMGFGSGSSSFTITCWIEYYDVDLAVPSSQMAGGVKPVNFTPRRATPDYRESMSAQGKPISSVLSSISLASDYLARIPLLSSVMGTASWVTNYLANGAYSWGYSKPSFIAPPTRVMKETMQSFITTDNVDHSNYLALSQENKLTAAQWSGTDVDEMAVSYVTGRPSIWRRGVWAMTDTVGTVLQSIPIDPRQYGNDVGSTVQVRYSSNLTYAASFASFWRGSICFKFHFAKTEFHSGRLAFQYSRSGTFTADQNPQTIVDCREGSEFIITIPFADMNVWEVNNAFTTAVLRVTVLNALVGPDTVTNIVPYTVEVFGGSDFELAWPGVYDALAPTFATPLMRGFAESQMQAPTDRPGPCDLMMTRMIGSGNDVEDNIAPAAVCMGERFTSFRQLIKRYGVLFNTQMTSASFTPTVLANRAGSSAAVRQADYFTYIASMYYGNCGSVRFKATVSSRVPLSFFARVFYAATNTLTSLVTTFPATINTIPVIHQLSHITSAQDKNSIEFTTPPYMQGLYRIQYTSAQSMPSAFVDTLGVNVGFYFAGTIANTEVSQMTVLRAAGEDFNCGIYIGPPPLALT